jgi:hypothetical protein
MIKLVLLLCASLSLHSALALPLSSVLASNYHAVIQSDELAGQYNTNSALKRFSYQQNPRSKLQTSLLKLQEDSPNDDLIHSLFLTTLNILEYGLSQSDTQLIVKLSYQTQRLTYTAMLGTQNALYTQKSSYQAKLQSQFIIS